MGEKGFYIILASTVSSRFGEKPKFPRTIGCKNKRLLLRDLLTIYIRCFFAVVLLLLVRFEREVGEYTIAVGPRFLTAGPFFSGRFTARYARRNYAANFYTRFIFFPRTHLRADIRNCVSRNNVTDHRQIGRKHKYLPFESSKSEYVSPLLRERPNPFRAEWRLQFWALFVQTEGRHNRRLVTLV